MRVTFLAVLTLCFSAVLLEGQPTRNDLRRGANASPLERNDEGAALTKTFVAKQLVASAAGMFLLGGAGGLIAANTSSAGEGFTDLANTAVAAIAGGVLGSAIGVYWFSKRHGHRSPFLASLAGAAVGTLGFAAGGAVLVTVPVAAVTGHNWARR